METFTFFAGRTHHDDLALYFRIVLQHVSDSKTGCNTGFGNEVMSASMTNFRKGVVLTDDCDGRMQRWIVLGTGVLRTEFCSSGKGLVILLYFEVLLIEECRKKIVCIALFKFSLRMLVNIPGKAAQLRAVRK
ncbi:hypothetical protein RvY_12125 [Ramazzottius varieornatus]|uniref:Uncharacterized protein n=1 Tax=Ramazzottius varieornatus TaxID=947166 RepID=A0A1D1VKS6_RAMVA|nr:hypothetical protein RvY_12125 [Ramazzottius varieornatus]